ncbi:cysteine desulfurase [Candidatus Saccharibacteria bacterium]|nr:cysteine desulfurase [Candidatus Saccharibacteria bacterium]
MNNSSRIDFPIFTDRPNLVYLDSAATALKPQIVIDAITDYYTNYSANIHRGIYPLSENATDRYENARRLVARLINASPANIIFNSGTTAGINQVANSYLDKLSNDDEIVVSRAEHHANLLPWQNLAEKTGAKIVIIDAEDLQAERIKKHLSHNTKIVALAHISNVLGTINDIASIIKTIRQNDGETIVVVDGAQAVPHIEVDLSKLDVDYYAFSGHKMYGPTGIGALYVKQSRFAELRPLILGGGAISTVSESEYCLLVGPQGHEAGTPPIAEAIGMGAAAEYLLENRQNSEDLSDELHEKLNKLDFVTVLGGADNRAPLASFTVENVHAHDVAQFLADNNICVRAGHHCTMPLHNKLNISATTRASLGLYNSSEDIDYLVSKLIECYETLGKL